MEKTINNKRKTVFTALGAILLVAITVLGTLAFLTSTTDTVTNTFAFGEVSFDTEDKGKVGKGLNESFVDEYGYKVELDDDGNFIVTTEDGKTYFVDAQGKRTDTPTKGTQEDLRVVGNDYKLVPGKTYVKNPTAYIKEGSEPAYVYAEVVNGLKNLEQETTIANQMKALGWINIDGNVWRREEAIDARNEAKDVIVFNEFTVDQDATIDSKPADITVRAFAIQADIDAATANTEATTWFSNN